MIDINDIDFSTLTPHTHTVNKIAKVYMGTNTCIKIWNDNHLAPHSTLNGLSTRFHGFHTMQMLQVGLITKSTCPAFVDTIVDNGRCCGYMMQLGHEADLNVKLLQYITELVDHSLDVGFLLCDVSMDNIIVTVDGYSIIDLDQSPISIAEFGGLTDAERRVWVRLLTGGPTTPSGYNDHVAKFYIRSIMSRLGSWELTQS